MMRTHFSLALLLAPAQHANAFSSVPACDAQALRTARFATLAGFSAPFGVFTRLPWNATLTLDEFVDALAPHFEEDFEVTAPYGAGKYKGLRKAAEYLMVGIAPTNLGFWSTVGTTGGFSSLVEEGDAITTVTETATAYFFGQHPGNGTEQINRFEFKPCSSLISRWDISPTAQFVDFARNFVWTANYSTYQGMYDVCMHHEAYCTGEYRQYESFDACLSYLTNSVPLVSATCADKAPLAGFSQTCKMKHKFLVPFDQNHCFHLGPAILPDGSPNYDEQGVLLCDDNAECDLWADGPSITIGAPPQSFFDASISYDSWVVDTWANADGSFDVDNYKFPYGAPPP